jgi:plastocyanin
LFIKSDLDGKQVTQFNPKVVWGTIKKGDSYTGGDANSGLGFDNPQALLPYFELKIDAAPGSYNYYCDVHPGMAGIIEVVDDATKIPSPVDVVSDGFAETQKVLGAGFGLQADLSKKASEAKVEGDTITVMLGSKAGQTAIGGLFPGVVVIKPGQKVTWTLPQEAVGLLTAVGSLPLPNMQESMNMIPPSGDRKVPIIALTDLMVSGAPKTSSAVGLKDKWFSGVLNPGSSYTLTFTEPGVYKYGALTSNGDGAVVVLP